MTYLIKYYYYMVSLFFFFLTIIKVPGGLCCKLTGDSKIFWVFCFCFCFICLDLSRGVGVLFVRLRQKLQRSTAGAFISRHMDDAGRQRQKVSPDSQHGSAEVYLEGQSSCCLWGRQVFSEQKATTKWSRLPSLALPSPTHVPRRWGERMSSFRSCALPSSMLGSGAPPCATTGHAAAPSGSLDRCGVYGQEKAVNPRGFSPGGAKQQPGSATPPWTILHGVKAHLENCSLCA